jgi:flagellar hook-length control protein FliK
LAPENLGRVIVQVALVDQSVSARIMVTNSLVKEALQNHMVDLKTVLSQAGLQIDQLHVQVGGGSSNLLAQYFQYQQEGYGARLPDYGQTALDEAKTLENNGLLGAALGRMTLVDVLA